MSKKGFPKGSKGQFSYAKYAFSWLDDAEELPEKVVIFDVVG